ncbi:GAF domain-containing protein [Nonomuraea zeae]|uniref:GAF domain-containing protein n=1 Tax=Nonomuraea zeae TaxID=1642303 RepID=A0A5S4FVQ7_9ACTN|nr:GAF domain-containing protein [Nonomuraea zeae]TMR24867.1 GAF domain-containing protein [Nonomuraea zeae]
MSHDGRWATLAAQAVPGPAREERLLLQSVVEAARAIFAAAAGSVLLLDATGKELVFEAVAGEGQEAILGRRTSAEAGIAGWVLAAGEPVAVRDVPAAPALASGAAGRAGYVPRAILAAPLLYDGEVSGVLEVLDPVHDDRRTFDDLRLLGLFAYQAVVALHVVRRHRAARQALTGDGAYAELVRIVSALEAMPRPRRQAGLRMLTAVGDLLKDG